MGGLTQQPAQYSMYMLNKYAFNPAYAGMDNSLSLTGVYRNQWLNLDGNPVSQNFNVHMPLYIVGGGIGLAAGYLDLVRTALADIDPTLRPHLAPAALGADAGIIGVAALAEDLRTNNRENRQ